MKSNKNDANDVEAICEAMSRSHMRFVTLQSLDHQDIQATHRIRAELKDQRNARTKQIHGLLAEYGLVALQSLLALRAAIPDWFEHAENGLTDYFRSLLHGLWGDLLALDHRIKELDKKIAQLVNGNEVTRQLQQLRGLGPMAATALVATVGTGVGETRECPSTSSTKERLGADARITHYGPASTHAN